MVKGLKRRYVENAWTIGSGHEKRNFFATNLLSDVLKN